LPTKATQLTRIKTGTGMIEFAYRSKTFLFEALFRYVIVSNIAPPNTVEFETRNFSR